MTNIPLYTAIRLVAISLAAHAGRPFHCAFSLASGHVHDVGALRRVENCKCAERRPLRPSLNMQLWPIGLRTRRMECRTDGCFARETTAGLACPTVEHVHVHKGGQAIVGSVSQSGGGGIMTKTEDNPMHRKTREPSRLRQAPCCLARQGRAHASRRDW